MHEIIARVSSDTQLMARLGFQPLRMHNLIFMLQLLFLVSSSAYAEILRVDCETYANFSVVHEDKKLNSHAFKTLFETQQSRCEYECSHDSRCKSINFKRKGNICELHDKSADDARDRISTITSVGWTFYSPSYKERLVIEFYLCINLILSKLLHGFPYFNQHRNVCKSRAYNQDL